MSLGSERQGGGNLRMDFGEKGMLAGNERSLALEVVRLRRLLPCLMDVPSLGRQVMKALPKRGMSVMQSLGHQDSPHRHR
jgi:hypothetical protein